MVIKMKRLFTTVFFGILSSACVCQFESASALLSDATWYESMEDGMLLGESSNFPSVVGHDGGGALTFEQIQTVPEESSFEIAGLENWTLSVWVQQSTNGESNLVGRSDGGGTTNKWWLGYGWNAHPGFVLHTNRPGSPYQGVGYNSPPIEPQPESWTHVVCRCSSSIITLFVNGSAAGSEPLAYPIPSSSQPLMLGGASNDNPGATGVTLDDLAFWNRALSDDEVMLLASVNDEGCTDPLACNYNANAAADDGSCLHSEGIVSELPEFLAAGDEVLLVADNALLEVTEDAPSLSGLTYRSDFRGNHIYYSNTALIWSEAENTCVMGGGHLASIADAEENAFIRSLSGDYIHLGLTDSQSEGNWVWTDGTPFSYSNWNGGEPNNSGGSCRPLGENFAAMYSNGRWNDDLEYYCGDERTRHFACEIPLTTSEIPNWTNEWSTGAFGDSLFLTLTSDTTIFLTATNDSGGTCTFSQSVAINVFPGCTSSTACNYDPSATMDDGTCIEFSGILAQGVSVDTVVTCAGAALQLSAFEDTAVEANDPPLLEWSNGVADANISLVPAQSGWFGLALFDVDGMVACSDSIWFDVIDHGCNDSDACNFNSEDLCDVDCIYPLFDGDCDAGSIACGPGTTWNATLQICQGSIPAYLNEPGAPAQLNPCYFDTDLSGAVNVTDLMNLLSVFGLSCDE